MKTKSIYLFSIIFILIYQILSAQDNKPKILLTPADICVESGKPFSYPFKITDKDLCDKNYNEELTLNVIEPACISFSIDKIIGPRLDSTGNCLGDTLDILLQSVNFQASTDSNYKVKIKFYVSDKNGNTDTCTFDVTQSDQLLWKCQINIKNIKGDFGTLYFGVAEKYIKVSTGDGSDGSPIGILDKNICEEEIPEVSDPNAFDVRWRIPKTLGTQTNIYPYDLSNLNEIYFPTDIQPLSSSNYPILMWWDRTQIPALNDVVENPYKISWYLRDPIANGNIITLNMRTGTGDFQTNWFNVENRGDTCYLTCLSDAMPGLSMAGLKSTPVEEISNNTDRIVANISPNPFSEKTSFQFHAENDGLVNISIYDLLGNCVQELFSEFVTQGYHEISWQPDSISPGAYICLFQFGNRIEKKIIIFER